ncbi:MAG: hypothetical protein JSR17_05125 [Proteobacteria bacterium]|nr:hypothetical protein [Pseudomonadota bacterium]
MKLFRKSDKPLTQEEITHWLRDLRGHPYNPSSHFDVTGVFRVKYNGDDSYYFAGVNVENEEHRLGTHAEEGCIAAMVTAFGKDAEIVEGWIMGAPDHLKPGDTAPLANNKVTCCGKCRQQNIGFASSSAVIHSISLNGAHQQTTMGDSLPDHFSFRQFAPELVNPSEKQPKPLAVEEIEAKLIRKGKALSDPEILEWLHNLESVDYASQRGQAVVLKLADNTYVAGVKIEDAAYVSINPIQCAMAIANVACDKIAVESVWTLSNKRKAQKDQALTQFHEYQFNKNPKPLTLSAVQVLAEFAAHDQIPIHMFTRAGHKQTISMRDSAHMIPVLSRKKMDDKYKQRLAKI